MKVKEAIQKLQSMPPDAEIDILYDGRCRMGVDIIYLAKGGAVVATGYSQVAYDDNERPVSAPSVTQDQYWQTEDDPNKSEWD